jgi:C-terminal processing protease CtpA/Prc
MIGPFTYSSAIVFAATAQDSGVARIAGQETGGLACQTGRITRVGMANTGLNGFAPVLWLARPSGEAGCARGVIPNIALRSVDGEAAVEDLAEHIRTELSNGRR